MLSGSETGCTHGAGVEEAVQVLTGGRSGRALPGPASRSQCRHLGVVPRESWDPHPHPASADLLGSLARREEPQIGGRKKRKKMLTCGVVICSQALWERFPHSCGPPHLGIAIVS